MIAFENSGQLPIFIYGMIHCQRGEVENCATYLERGDIVGLLFVVNGCIAIAYFGFFMIVASGIVNFVEDYCREGRP